MLANNVADLVSNVTSDFNYLYTNSGSPNMFTILKRSEKDPFRSFPVITVGFSANLQFIDNITVVKKLCEMYAEEEHKYKKEMKDED